ncbi:serine/threonine-protein phosphatase 6 regulatory ankyrin repeat subunit B-like [Corticium candelabrum]|uniref:serine/threonine-protein phosphatase 6 regulatory ankyrin repeat subunit B-like n=1 Tax=Corticium candelabrum TaxID=121492 RepID=UPI002E275036|nr:serine/threonine-protein phosphatase 6 regulatory ankyrin repeat subunit B-like [Corticium candelabrum]
MSCRCVIGRWPFVIVLCDRVVSERSGKLQRNEMEENVAEAARKADWEEVRRLVEQGGNVNDVDREQRRTALHWAMARNSHSICSFLLSRGANVSQIDKDGDTPLHLAAYDLHVDICQLLVDYKADVTSVNNKGQTPLHIAVNPWCAHDFSVVCPPLITNESVNVEDRHGNRALHIAVKNVNIRTVQLLVDCGADVNAWGKDEQTPLHTAADGEEDCPELCSILLEHDAKINTRNKHGNLPLHLLLSKGADVNAWDKDGQTPLHTAANGEEDSPELCSILLEHDARTNMVNKHGNQPLHLAWKRGHTRTSRLLLSKGADANAWDKDGQTPLHTAAGGWKDSPELCSILLKHNAKVNAVDKDGKQPLHLACKQRNAATTNLLLSYGADVTALNKEQREFIHVANESMLNSCQEHNAASADENVTKTELHNLAKAIQSCWIKFALDLDPEHFTVLGEIATIRLQQTSPLLQAQARIYHKARDIDYEAIINDFARKHPRRMELTNLIDEAFSQDGSC